MGLMLGMLSHLRILLLGDNEDHPGDGDNDCNDLNNVQSIKPLARLCFLWV